MRKPTAAARAVFGDLLLGAFFRERFTRQPIKLESQTNCLIAENLVAQGVDGEGRFLASRGYNLYRFDGTGRFEFLYRLPSPMGIAKLLQFPGLRSVLGKRDIVQVFQSATGSTIAQSGGVLYRKDPGESRFRERFKLRFWGRSGRGIYHHGIAQATSGRLLFGEYFSNPERLPVRIYASDDDGLTWFAVHEFKAGDIRHVHAVYQDPYEDHVWVCAGDTDDESRILRSDDGGATFDVVGQGSQTWRCCTLLFDEHYVYWGADTELYIDYRHLYKYRRADGALKRIAAVDGAIEFGIFPSSDLQVFATTRGGYGNVPDDCPSLLVCRLDDVPQRIRLEPRINSARGSAAGTKLYFSRTSQQVCMSFTNMTGMDGKLAIVPLGLFRQVAQNPSSLERWRDIGEVSTPVDQETRA